MFQWIKNRISSLRASLVRKHRIKEVVRTLCLAHASELAHTPGEQWPLVKERQAREILAVQEGKLDIVDRRSWVFPYLPETLHRLKQPIIKNTPYNIRRFSRTPVPRRAINIIKSAITSLQWGILPLEGTENDITDEQRSRIKIAEYCLNHPNNTESFLQFQEEGIDDMCVNGAFVIEPQLTPNPERPFKLWTVDSTTIRIFADWKESTPDQPHYAQMTGLKGERGIIVFYDDELIYMKDNPQVDSPFGMGKMEVAFQSINHFLGIQDMSGRAGSDQIHKTWLWWEQAQVPSNIDIIRRHIMNDLEGQSKVSIVAGMKAPQTIDINPVTVDDLLLPWQEMLIRMIANGFDMSAMALNLERDINRSTGAVLDDKDFRTCVVPMARRLEEGYTRFILHRLLGWTDLKFKYLNMDDPDAATKMTINQQLFVCDAKTPNEIRKSMGLPVSNSPYADLTQFEMGLITIEANAVVAQASAQTAFGQQQQMMQQYSGGGAGGASSGPGGASSALGPQLGTTSDGTGAPKTSGAPSATGKPGQSKLKSPAAVATPAMPNAAPKRAMAGSKYTALEVAAMSAAQVQQAQKLGQLPPDKKVLSKQMQIQQPGLLEKLSDELKEYFDLLEKNKKEEDESESVELTSQDKEEQLQRFNEFQHEPPEIERVINKGTEKSPRVNTKRILKYTSHSYGSPNTSKAFQRSGLLNKPGRGKELSTNIPPGGWPKDKRKKKK